MDTGGSDDNESACNAGDTSSIPGLEDRMERMVTHSQYSSWKFYGQKRSPVG